MDSATIKSQVASILSFFSAKRDLYAAEAEATIKDIRESRVFDDVYTRQEIDDMFDECQKSVRERVKRDMETIISTSALLIEQLLTTMETGGVKASIDLGRTEDIASINRMRDWMASLSLGIKGDFRSINSRLALASTSSNALVFDNEFDDEKGTDINKKSRQSSVAGEKAGAAQAGASANDNNNNHEDELIALQTEAAALKEEIKALRERHDAMQRENAGAVASKAESAAKVLSLQVELEALKGGKSEIIASKEGRGAEIERLTDNVRDLKSQLEAAKTGLAAALREREVKIQMSKPFQQLKALLQRKNAQLAEIRSQMERFVPRDDLQAEF